MISENILSIDNQILNQDIQNLISNKLDLEKSVTYEILRRKFMDKNLEDRKIKNDELTKKAIGILLNTKDYNKILNK